MTSYDKEVEEKFGLKAKVAAGAENDGEVSYLPWRNAEFTFNAVKPFFDSDSYSLAIFAGLVQSSGGLTESTLKASKNVLLEYLSAM